MKNQTNYLKIYIVPLLIVFLFSKVKAESYGSAFTSGEKIFQNDSLKLNLLNDKYELAEKLFQDKNYSKSLKLAYSLLVTDDDLLNIKVNYLLGKIFSKNKNINLSIKYFNVSLNLIEKNRTLINESSLYASELRLIEAESLLLIGKTYIDKYNESRGIDSSFYFLKKLVAIESIEEKISSFKARAYNNLSIHEYWKKDYTKAENYSFKSIEILENLNNKQGLSASYISLANIYEVTNKRQKALTTYFKALPYIENKNDAKSLEYKEILYYNIAWTLYNLKDYKAYEYLEKSYDLKDSLINVGLRKELKKIERTHNIDLIRKEEENKREKLIQNNWFIGITGALISLLFLYLANLNKLKQKNLSLELSKKELEQRKKLEKLKSDSQIKIINATIDGRETERKVIAETLHDNVSALLSSAKMNLQATQKQLHKDTPLDLDKTKKIIAEASDIVRDLSHTLMSSVLLKFGLEYAIKDNAKKFSNSTIQIYTAIKNVFRYDQEFEIKVYNITQEFVNNVLKHSKATTAYIIMEEENNNLLVIVKDNGCGFKIENKDDNGIGLSQIEVRVTVMGGDFSIDSNEEEGTKITISIPVVRKKEKQPNPA